MTKSISKNLTSDGVLNNYNILPEQYDTNLNSSSRKALYFPAGELEVADDDRLTKTESGAGVAFSISVWIKIPSDVGDTGSVRMFVRKGDWDNSHAGSRREYVCGLTSQDKPYIYLCDESSDVIRKCTADEATRPSELYDQWNHFVFASRGLGATADLAIARNGAAVASTTSDSASGYEAMENKSDTLKIGHSNLKAYIADVAILSVDVINTDDSSTPAKAYVEYLYNGGCPIDIPHPIIEQAVAWWRMGDYELDAVDGTGTGSGTNRIYDRGTDAVAHNAIPNSTFAGPGFSSFFAEANDCTPFIPFSFGVRGVPFLRNRSEPYKANLD